VGPQSPLFFCFFFAFSPEDGDAMLVKTARKDDIEAIEKILETDPQAPVVADVRRSGPSGIVEITVFYPDRGISLDDCSVIARRLSDAPEILKAFGEDAAFSVASPGLGRRLTTDRELKVFTGRNVIAAWRDASTRAEHEESCLLSSADGHHLVVTTASGAVVEIEWNEVRSVRLTEHKESPQR
jgi:ribosome maturation factor RimP